MLQESGENYLEAILVLSESKQRVRSVDVAQYFSFSKPSVSVAMAKLRGLGYVDVEYDGALVLTETGKEIASRIYERHTLLSSWLELLGVEKKTAVQDACRIEHVISAESFEKIKQHVNRCAKGYAKE